MEYFVEPENRQLHEYGIEFFPEIRSAALVTALSHVHPAVEILYFKRGAFRVGTSRAEFTAQPGEAALFRSGEVHTIFCESPDGGLYYVLKISPQFLMRIFTGQEYLSDALLFLRREDAAKLRFSADELRGEAADAFERMIRVYEGRDRDFFVRERIAAASLLLALARLLRDGASDERDPGLNLHAVAALYGCLAYINEHFASDVTPYECADRLHLSYSYFAKLFRSLMGETFKDYLRSVRLSEAKNKVLLTDLPITEVASSCGYASLSYFIAEFRRAYGLSPGQMRRRAADPIGT